MNNNSSIRAVIYGRVSTKEQAQGKPSIPQQINSCKKVIAEHGWKLIKDPFIDSGISGHLLKERKGLQDLLADAKDNEFDLVVVTDFDRFARNKSKASQIRDALKKQFIQTYAIATPVEPKTPQEYDPIDDDLGIMVEGFSDTMAEIERNKIRRRMMMGKEAIAKSGKIPNKVPFGYKVERWIDNNGKVQRKIVIDEEKAKIVRRIFVEYISGKGKRTIAFGLVQDGIKSPKGGLWTAHTIDYILKNETYTGKVLWGWRHPDYKITKRRKQRGKKGIRVEGEHKPIISIKLFKQAQHERKIRGHAYKGRAQQSKGLLTGIAKCIRCGSGVTYLRRIIKNSRRNPNWNDVVTYEYLCAGHKYSRICKPKVMSARKLEGRVLDQIRSLINNPKAKEKLVINPNIETAGNFNKELKRSLKKLDEIPRKRERQQEAYERGLISIEEYGAAMERLRKEEQQYHAVATKYKYQAKELEARKEELERYLETLKDS